VSFLRPPSISFLFKALDLLWRLPVVLLSRGAVVLLSRGAALRPPPPARAQPYDRRLFLASFFISSSRGD
jgi:hypothetical protein